MSRKIKRTLKIFGIFVGVLILLLAVLIAPAVISMPPVTDSYLLKDAEFDSITFNDLAPRDEIQPGKSNKPRSSASYHAIKPGKGAIIAIRHFDDGTAALDDELFWKLTIWMPEYKDGTYDLKNEKDFITFYSRGASAWIRGICSGEVKSGTLTIKGNNVTLKSDITCTIKNSSGDPTVTSLNETWELDSISTGNLNYWIGKKGAEHPYTETYRRR